MESGTKVIVNNFYIIMKQSEARERIDTLRKEIVEHNNKYYIQNQPEISDFEFDILMNELDTLEKKFPQFMSEIGRAHV
jgi:DNA ligase (NAD+)